MGQNRSSKGRQWRLEERYFKGKRSREEETREGWMTNGKWLCSYRFFILDKPAEFRKQACRHEDHGLLRTQRHVPRWVSESARWVTCKYKMALWQDAPWEDTAQLCSSTGVQKPWSGGNSVSKSTSATWLGLLRTLKTWFFDLCCPDSFNTWALS